MEVKLVPVVLRGKYDPPFDGDDGYTYGWWDRWLGGDDSVYVQVLRDGEEVARVMLDETVGIEHYVNTPPLGDVALEIQFIDVRSDVRRQGIGRAVVEQLARMHPDRRLVAYSEEADEFWSALGWQRYDHPEGPPHLPRKARSLASRGRAALSPAAQLGTPEERCQSSQSPLINEATNGVRV